MNVLSVGFGAALAMSMVGCNNAQFSPIAVEDPLKLVESTEMKETLTQGSQPSRVDMLIVTDNSRSMAEEQSKMADRTNSLLEKMESLDWRIGFTTTDVSDGPYGMRGSLLPLMGGGGGHVLKKNENGVERIFAETIAREETLNCPMTANCPSGDEQPLEATWMALQKKSGANKDFFRSSADLMVIIISDEDERSNGAPGAMTGQELVSRVRTMLNPEQKFIVSAIVVKPEDSSCHATQQPDGQYGTVISGLVTLTGGFLGSVCATDYGEQLASIGDLVRRAADSFELSRIPKAGTLALSFSPAQPETEWKLVGNKVVFTKNAPPIGTQMSVTYEPQ